MKKLLPYLFAFSFLITMSCKNEVEKPKVIYDNDTKPKEVATIDTSKIVVADLPIQIPSTNVLIHPIGELRVTERKSKLEFESSSYQENQSYTVSNHNEYEITGYLSNLKIQDVGSDSLKTLTQKPVLIQTITYLRTIADKTKKQLLVYSLADMDTNKDGKLDTNDIQSLYLSEINGNNFIKISPDFQEVINWNVIESRNRLYYRTIEDTNKNGKFDKKDIVHYHFINLLEKDWKIQDYNPIL